MIERKYDLEERLLQYSVMIVRLVEGLNRTQAGRYIGDHLLRSGVSPYFNHGEAVAAESARDFVHKMRVCLKELREVMRALRLAKVVPLCKSPAGVDELLTETDELIRIFAASIRTAEKKIVHETTNEWNVET